MSGTNEEDEFSEPDHGYFDRWGVQWIGGEIACVPDYGQNQIDDYYAGLEEEEELMRTERDRVADIGIGLAALHLPVLVQQEIYEYIKNAAYAPLDKPLWDILAKIQKAAQQKAEN